MKTRYLTLIAIVSLTLLSGCQNRITDYEPYSAFDDRMAEATQPPMTPDDQMPPMDSDNQYSSRYAAADDSYASPPSSYDDPPKPRHHSIGSSSSDLEVPYADSTKSKRPAYNIGGLTN